MPYEDPDATDPMTLHGVAVPTDGDQAHREMAACFVEEYLRLGHTPEQILKMFQTKGYAGPYLAFEILGQEAIASIIEEYAQRWGPRQRKQVTDRNADGDVVLPILEQ
jgi:hypothetical protein